MLDYKIKRLLLNPHRIRYFYELDALLEFWDVNGKFDSNEDLYTAFKSLGTLDGKYEKLTDSDRKIFMETILNSNVYKDWAKEYEAQEFYRKLSWPKKLSFHLWNMYLSIIKYPQIYLSLVSIRIKTYLDYQENFKAFVQSVKESFKVHNDKINDLIVAVHEIENKRKKKAKKVKKNAH